MGRGGDFKSLSLRPSTSTSQGVPLSSLASTRYVVVETSSEDDDGDDDDESDEDDDDEESDDEVSQI